jgi:hypothetical protein
VAFGMSLLALINSSPEIEVVSSAHIEVVEAPVVVIIVHFLELASISVDVVEINEVISSEMSLFNGG